MPIETPALEKAPSSPTNNKVNSSKKINPSKLGTKSLMEFMDSLAPQAPTAVFFSNCSSPVRKPVLSDPKATRYLSSTKFTASSPEKGPLTSAVTSPGGTKYKNARTMTLSKGTVSLFLPSHQVVENDIKIPSKPTEWLKKVVVPCVSMNGFINVPLTEASIKKVENKIGKRLKEGYSARSTSQNSVMKIGATAALKYAGFILPNETSTKPKVKKKAKVSTNGLSHGRKKGKPQSVVQWVHFISHALWADEAQIPENLGIGTRQANAAMEMVNRCIRNLVFRKTTPQKLYLSIIPTWVPGYENIRLLKSLEMRLCDSLDNSIARKFSVHFNMLSMAPICESEIEPIRVALMQEFDYEENRIPKTVSVTDTTTTTSTTTTVSTTSPVALPASPSKGFSVPVPPKKLFL